MVVGCCDAGTRAYHTATLLTSGDVLVAGGYDGATLTDAVIYHSQSNTWSAAGLLTRPRSTHTATLLPSGNVLVVGGLDQNGIVPQADIYHPDWNSWSSGPTMAVGRYGHTATLLSSGQVLITGGTDSNGQPVNTAEIFDSATYKWTVVAPMNTARTNHAAILLPTDDVLITGGYAGASLASAERFNIGLGYLGPRTIPQLFEVSSSLALNSPFGLTGSGFLGDSEASGGSSQSSPTNFPLVQMRRLDNEQLAWQMPDPTSYATNFGYQSAALTGVQPGMYAVRVFINGIPTNACVVPVESELPSDRLFSDGFDGASLPTFCQ